MSELVLRHPPMERPAPKSGAHPRNCRHCSHMTCGDANWCDAFDRTMSDGAIRVPRDCLEYELNTIDALTLDGIDDGYKERREKALYEKRMRGDWS